ncbi:MAG: DUF4886 domain-containing protein [Clostridia bacterium]|nr:DUF4886 domain-containing protein [Clostridia bacterium]
MKFKKFLAAVLAALSVFFLFVPATAFETARQDPFQSEEGKSDFKILAIGNSYSDDAFNFLYSLAKSAGAKNIAIGSLDVPACDLKTHRKNAQGDLPVYRYSKWSKESGGKKRVVRDISLLSAIKDENWDYISLQQASALSGISKTYNADFDYLVKYVSKNRPMKTTKICWFMTWAYAKNYRNEIFKAYHFSQAEMYKAICSAVSRKVLVNEKINLLIPVGTAIQNMRTGYIGDNLNRDGRHLNKIGKYVAAMTFVKSLGFSIEEIGWLPKDNSVSASYLPAIKKAVNDAVEQPLKVTNESSVCNHESGENVRFNTLSVKKGFPATCVKDGLTDEIYCKVCKNIISSSKVVPKNENHKYKYTVLRPATVKGDGEMLAVCSRCKTEKLLKISSVKKIKLLKTSYKYTGKPINVSVSVIDSAGKKLKAGEDYTLLYGIDGRTNVGKHSVKVVFKNKYFGKADLEFKIVPKGQR